MFSKKDKSTKSIVKNTIKLEESHIINSQFYNLTDNVVLLLTRDKCDLHFGMKVITMNKQIQITNPEQGCFFGCYVFLGAFPDGSFLIADYTYLYKFKSNALEVVSKQKTDKPITSVGIIDDNSFFVIERMDGYPNRYVKIYFWSDSYFSELPKEFHLTVYPKLANYYENYYGNYYENYYEIRNKQFGKMKTIIPLGNHRYACPIKGYDVADFRVLILSVESLNEVKQFKVRECGLIDPQNSFPFSKDICSGEIITFPDGKLVNYHRGFDNINIWDTEILKCLKEWKWTAIKTPKHFDYKRLDISTCPDNIHLLLNSNKRLYLFNTKSLEFKKIKIEKGLDKEQIHHVLPDGQMLALRKNSFLSQKNDVNVIHFDTKEMKNFRHPPYKESLFLLWNYLKNFQIFIPQELILIIFSNLLTDNQKYLAEKEGSSLVFK